MGIGRCDRIIPVTDELAGTIEMPVIDRENLMNFRQKIALSLLVTIVSGSIAFAQIVEIPDPNLREAVRETLNLPADTAITREAMLQLSDLDVKGRGVSDLTGLEFATNLTRLKLRKNPILNFAPVAHLTRLKELGASYCGLTDISPIAHLAEIEVLSLYANNITDIAPLANLTKLRWLRIERNRIVDHGPLHSLNLEHFTHDLETPCDMAPLPLAPRIENRNFPSIFTAWSDKDKWPSFDLIFCCPRFDTRLTEINGKFYFRTAHSSWDGPRSLRDAYLAQNPTMVFLHGLAAIWGDTAAIPEDSPWWLRNENGDILYRWGNRNRGWMNLNHPGYQQHIIEQAVTIAQCGLYDGIFIDGWRASYAERRDQLPAK